MIIANKSDLENKQVSKEAGAEYAAKNRVMFMETSAKKDFQVSTAFEKLAEKLIDTKWALFGACETCAHSIQKW